MERVSAVMLRASFVWLLVGMVGGAFRLTDRQLSGEWRSWATPSHGHVLFVGWFIQFALGVGYWLLPRRRSPAKPLGDDSTIAMTAIVALNVGLLLRLTAEPGERAGVGAGWTEIVPFVSTVIQAPAAAVFVALLWPLVGPRPARVTVHPTGHPVPIAPRLGGGHAE